MKDSTNETKGNIWKYINVLIATLTLFGGVFFLTYTYGITSALFNIGLPVNIALVLFYENFKKYGRFRKTVIGLRITAIIIFVSGILAPIIVFNFKNTKLMYPLKRFCYGYGVFSTDFNNDILPLSLPEKCDDYLFITKGSVPAQDYHACAYLIFHTDKNTLKKYEEHFNSVDNAERHMAHMPDKEDKWYSDENKIFLKCPEELPQDVFQSLEPEHIHNFENAVIYIHYSKGCMLDYDSGLAVFWY